MNEDGIARLLTQQGNAYKLLLWLDKQAGRDPTLFSRETLAALREGTSCGDWLTAHRESLPQELLPAESEWERFAFMLASFFETSFHVRTLEFGGRVLESRLERGAEAGATWRARRRHPRSVMMHAVRQLAAEEHMPIDQRSATRLVDRSDIRQDVLIWTYVVELGRRGVRRGKGPPVHSIWRAIAPAVRRALTTEIVWQARSRLLAKIREVHERERGK